MQITVPLNKLILSPRNVRKTPVADHEIAMMADSIASKGLLQNLVVSEGTGGKGFYDVDAGGCRLRALQLLADRKVIARNAPIACLVIPRDDAREASLAENATTIAMNPADEVVAYREILEQYAEAGILDRVTRIENLARRFGRTVHFVEQRLRLADLAPEILEALRLGRMTLDAAKAYAAYPDAKLQLKVFRAEEKKPEPHRHHARAVRDQIAGKVYSLDHPAVRYVGLEHYRAAGGRIALELFMGETEDREVVLDPALVDKLAAKRAGDDAQALAQEEGWRDGLIKPWTKPSWHDVPAPAGFRRAYGAKPDEMSEEARAESIRVFALAADGSTLEPQNLIFVPEEEKPPAPAPLYAPESAEQIAERERAAGIEHHALRLAAPSVAGTPLEGRIFWPHRHAEWIEPVQEAEDGDVIVAMLVRIPAADLAAVGEAATRAWEAEQAELAEEEAAEAAAPTAGPDDEDDRDTEEPAEPVAEVVS